MFYCHWHSLITMILIGTNLISTVCSLCHTLSPTCIPAQHQSKSLAAKLHHIVRWNSPAINLDRVEIAFSVRLFIGKWNMETQHWPAWVSTTLQSVPCWCDKGQAAAVYHSNWYTHPSADLWTRVGPLSRSPESHDMERTLNFFSFFPGDEEGDSRGGRGGEEEWGRENVSGKGLFTIKHSILTHCTSVNITTILLNISVSWELQTANVKFRFSIIWFLHLKTTTRNCIWEKFICSKVDNTSLIHNKAR